MNLRHEYCFISGGFERWFNLTVVNISEDDADDYTCVGVNAGNNIDL